MTKKTSGKKPEAKPDPHPGKRRVLHVWNGRKSRFEWVDK